MEYILRCCNCKSSLLQIIEHLVKDMYIRNECSELMELDEVVISEFDK